MRVINDHQVNPANDTIVLAAMDEAGAGGANHVYTANWTDKDGDLNACDFRFQNGPINENGVNGITQEVLLAVVADRLRCFQNGPFACRENALALTKVEEAMHWLQQRTLARMRRGVEGTNVA